MFFVKNHANRNVFSAAFLGSESTLRVCAKQGLGLPEAMALSKENPCCRLCGLQVPEEDARFHGPTFRCTICESSLRQIRRNMERSDLDGFSVEEQKTFFQRLHEEKKKRADGRLPWTTVRASLITAMTARSVTGYKSEVQGKKLPMDVWIAKGWSKETVERMPSEYSEEYGCQVYQLKIQQETWSDVFERMESRVLEQEQRAARKKGKKGGDVGGVDIPVDQDTGGRKGNPDKEAKTHAASQKKIKAQNVAQSNRAAKAMGPLNAASTSLNRMWDKAQKHLDKVPQGVQDSVKGILTELEHWSSAARACVNQQESNKTLPEESEVCGLAPLPFTPEELKTKVKQANEVCKAVRNALPQKLPAAGKRQAEGNEKENVAPAPDAGDKVAPEPKRRRIKKSA